MLTGPIMKIKPIWVFQTKIRKYSELLPQGGKDCVCKKKKKRCLGDPEMINSK